MRIARAARLLARAWMPLTGLAALALYLWYIVRTSFELDGHRGFTLFDDALISMRYAQNLAHGDGLRWNAHAPAVEGYTNFLWTLWMAVLEILPLSQTILPGWVALSSAVLLVLNLWIVRALVVGAGGRVGAAAFAVSACALSYPLVFWSLRGLEVGCLALLVDTAILLAWRAEEGGRFGRGFSLAATLAALVLMRDDAVVAAVVILAFLASDVRTRGVAILSLGAVVLALMGHEWFRIAYYGAPLPNTYYLKLEGIPLTARLARGSVALVRTLASESVLYLVLAGLALASSGRGRRVSMLGAVIVGQMGATVFVGGDAWEAWGQPDRFISVVIPAWTIMAALGLETLSERPRRNALVLALALVLRSFALAAGDFVPRSFTVTPPIDLHGGLRGLAHPEGIALLASVLVAAFVLAIRRPTPAGWALGTALSAVVIGATVGPNWRDFLRGELTARQIAWDADNAIFGARLGEAVPAATTIAVVAAGGIPFFSKLPAVDLLGKSDAHIAHELPLERFVPGHDKRDYAYSLTTWRPDVVLELWHHSPEELQTISALGYQLLPNGMYVRPGCPDELIDVLLHKLPAYPFTANRPPRQR